MDKQTGLNLTTTVGGLRDLIGLPMDGMGMHRASLVDAMLNVPYTAEWLTNKEGSAIRLTGKWPEGARLSGEISKTIRMSGKDEQDVIEVEYQFHAKEIAEGARAESKSVLGAMAVTAFSVPAVAQAPETTQFCWFASAIAEDAKSGQKEAVPHPAPACASFVAGADPITVPAEAARLEVRTLGRPTLGMEWTAGQVVIEQKQFSARILVEFPEAKTGEANSSGRFVVRYTVLQAP